MIDFLRLNAATCLQWIVMTIMFGMGTTLTIADFKRIVIFPKSVFLGLFGQLILFPAIGFLLAMTMPMRPEIAMGLILIAACPDGATSNVVSHLSKGDTALAITLTAFSGILTVFTIPLMVNLGLHLIYGAKGAGLHLPVIPTIVSLFNIMVLPVFVGMAFRHFFNTLAQRLEKTVSIVAVSCILMSLVIMALKLSERGNLWTFFKEAGPSVILLNVGTMIIGFGMATLFNLSMPHRVTIAIEAGIQNGSVGILIASSATLLNNPEMAAPSGVYAVVMCTISLLIFPFFRRLNERV
ncbi:MAG: hypothetical protein RL329_279 [Bacteroidota bacterium]|jgi:BASS family bile acid:Na+ symporter